MHTMLIMLMKTSGSKRSVFLIQLLLSLNKLGYLYAYNIYNISLLGPVYNISLLGPVYNISLLGPVYNISLLGPVYNISLLGPVYNISLLGPVYNISLLGPVYNISLLGPVISRAAAYTACVVGGLSATAACAPSDKFLYMAGPLSLGLGVVVVASLG